MPVRTPPLFAVLSHPRRYDQALLARVLALLVAEVRRPLGA